MSLNTYYKGRVIHDNRLYLMDNTSFNRNHPKEQYTYFSYLGDIDKLKANTPKDIVLHRDDCMSLDIKDTSTLDYLIKTYPYDTERYVKKVEAFLNKTSMISTKRMNQPTPDVKEIYYQETQDMILKYKRVAKPYTEWVINDIVYKDLFNSELYYVLPEYIIKNMNNFKPSITHGDMYPYNIGLHDNNIVILSPRASFGNGVSLLGDIRCDLAKFRLYLSNIIQVLDNRSYNIYVNSNNIFKYDIPTSTYYSKGISEWDNYCKERGYDSDEIKVLEGAILLRDIVKYKDIEQKKVLYMYCLQIMEPSLKKFCVF